MASKYSKPAGFENKVKIDDKDLITSKKEQEKKLEEEKNENAEMKEE